MSETGHVDISGLDKATVLAALYNASHPQGLGFLNAITDAMTAEEARTYLDGHLYFDYLKGRVLKVDLAGDSFDPWRYDRDNGRGAAATIITSLRQTNDANNAPYTHSTFPAQPMRYKRSKTTRVKRPQ